MKSISKVQPSSIKSGHLQKKLTAVAIGLGLGLGLCHLPSISTAAMPSSTVLSIDSAVGSCLYDGIFPDCLYGAVDITSGSFFQMGGNFAWVLDQEQGVIIDEPQPAGTGSHGGDPLPGDTGAVTAPWPFFNATGHEFTVGDGVNDNDDGTLDFSDWRVTWNGIPAINMGGDPGAGDTGAATITCTPDPCQNGSTYVLDYSAHVPLGDPSDFGGTQYDAHLEGTVIFPASPPSTQPDSAKTIVGNPTVIPVLDNDTSADGLDPGSVAIDTQATPGMATPNADGTITYDPQAAIDGATDMFTYTVDSLLGITSSPTDVDLTIQANVPPDANDDLGSDGVETNTTALDNAISSPDGGIVVDVLANDIDTNNDPGLPGGIDTSTVTILSQPAIGTCTVNPDGTITYTQTTPSVDETGTCSYEVSDIDPVGGALTSNEAFVDINIVSLQSDWPDSLDPDIIPYLIYEDGVPDSSGNTAFVPESGTYFSMDVSANTTIYTTLTKGPDGGFVIGYDQLAFGSHTGIPNGSETASFDLGWNFFGNTGLTFTKNGGIVGNPDGTLRFKGNPGVGDPPGQGRYQITWNGIPEIDLGGSPAFPEDLGFATIVCPPAPCDDGSTFDLGYRAHVPPGDPSGFGGVQYGLVMNGEVKFLDGAFQTSNGTFSVEDRLSSGDVPPDPDSEIQCAGGCFDYTITGVTDPSVSTILPLNGGVPAATTGEVLLRVFQDGTWGNFDTSGGDSVLSAPFTDGGPFGTTCPPPGDAAYVALTEGHQCLQVTISDNGPNDKDPAAGTITDPSGLGIPTFVPPPDNRKSGDSGCTIASTPVDPLRGGAWWLLAGLAAWMGWNRRKPRQH